MAGTFAIVLGLWFASALANVFLATLGIVLTGYAFLGRGFAYFGVQPLFIGELTLSLGLLAAVVSGRVRSVPRSPVSWLLVAFAAWGAIRTLPFWGIYGLDALRDGVLWGYGAFALLVAACLSHSRWLRQLPERYGQWLPWFLMWAPVGMMIQATAGEALPGVPGSDVGILYIKPGDVAVNLAGGAAFLFLGLHPRSPQQSRALPGWKEWLWWTVWLAGFFIVATRSRGGLLAVLTASLVTLALRPLSRWSEAMLIVGVLTTVLLTLNIEIGLQGERKVSPRQLLNNLQSIAGNTPHESLAGTKEWRLDVWKRIIDYTVFGEYFWTGKGFGINLADDDGFQGGVGPIPLRSPHNGHLTILARAGVPGLVLWVLLQGAFAVSLLRAYWRACRARQEWWARLDVWILAYWTAFMVNAAFDVVLEGPHGGIWFWSLFGLGIAVTEAQRCQRW